MAPKLKLLRSSFKKTPAPSLHGASSCQSYQVDQSFDQQILLFLCRGRAGCKRHIWNVLVLSIVKEWSRVGSLTPTRSPTHKQTRDARRHVIMLQASEHDLVFPTFHLLQTKRRKIQFANICCGSFVPEALRAQTLSSCLLPHD